MPRCYLVKKVKYPVDRDRSPSRGPSSPSEATVAPSPPPYSSYAVQLHNGFIHDLPPTNTVILQEADDDLLKPTDHDTECAKQLLDLSQSTHLLHPAAVGSPVGSAGSSACLSSDGIDSADDSTSSSGHVFNNGVTIGYTYDAFFVTDGRSRKKSHASSSVTNHHHNNSSEDNPTTNPAAADNSNNNNNTNSSSSASPAISVAEKTSPRPRYTCNECGKHYATSSNLSRHKQTHRSLDSKLAKKCPTCSKAYVSMPALAMHVLTHNLNHKCDVCGRAFSRPWLLQGHMRSHTGEKPYGCAHCGKAFADRSNLRAHMQTHSAFKNFKCKRCNKSFALKSYLNKHYESACFKDSTMPSSADDEEASC